MTKICLNMIVKNESHVIESTLINLFKYIQFDTFIICDTGSTDNTIEIIYKFFEKKHIKGHVYNCEWKNFGFNRTEALQKAYNKSDYLFIFDADDKIHGDFKLPKHLKHDKYDFKFGDLMSYKRPLLINNRKKWKFVGVLHEFLVSEEPIGQTIYLDGNYYVESGKSGNRSQVKDKYLKDAQILQSAFEDEKDIGLKCRYCFYTAQSYRDSNEVDKSIEWYSKVLDLDNWSQEKYFSCIMLGDLFKRKNNNEKAMYYYLKSIEYDQERIEGIVSACDYYLKTQNYLLCHLLAEKFKNTKTNFSDKLFIDMTKYNGQIKFFNSISAYYCNNKDKGYETTKEIIFNKNVNDFHYESTIINLSFYKDYLKKDNNIKSIFNSINHFIIELNKKDKLNNGHFDTWKTVYDIYKKELVKYKPYSFKNKKENPKVFISFTTCKRFHLFYQTINSILNTWCDINKIDYWFVVDDNSEEFERNNMKKLYPWIDYYFKNENQKGHASSMHIIYNKLKELKPKYWIHMEDDFLFFDEMNYIEKGIEGLKLLKNKNVKQILFNRSYGEIIDHYTTKCHKIINDDYAVHQFDKNKKINEPNCFYWPHYSFRPSIIDTQSIFELGNFDSKGFIEMIYAEKWSNKGYKSGFFNKITNLHIGRLTSERHDKTKSNSYELNQTSQFGENKNLKKDYNYMLNNDFIFIQGMDQVGYDHCLKKSINECIDECQNNDQLIGFNSLGFIKKKLISLTPSIYFKEKDGIYIKKKIYNQYLIDISLNNTQSDTNQSDTTQSNTTQSNTTQSNTTQSNTTQSNTTQSNTTQSNTTQSDTTQSDNNDSDNNKNNVKINPKIKIINLEFREDRKKKSKDKIISNGINENDFEFVQAINGYKVPQTREIYELFKGNDFAYRKGIIGCALSHFNLWIQLLNDKEHEYYIIMEDDFNLSKNFKNIILNLDDDFKKKDTIFLGYHMSGSNQKKYKDLYFNEDKDISIHKLNNNIYIGGYYCYSINKNGAKKMINYIRENKIKHGIDYLNKINKDLNSFEIQPHIVYSDWHDNRKVHNVDSNIQNNLETFDFKLFEDKPITIAFHDNCLCERGTSKALFQYAFYNKLLLGNNSIIFCEKNNKNNDQSIIDKFKQHFNLYQYESWNEVDTILKKYNSDYIFLIKYGTNDGKLSKVCKNIVQCVFTTEEPHGDYYISINKSLNKNKDIDVLPRMIDLPKHKNNLRKQLNIPDDAIIFGRHGGFDTFNIPYVQKTIIKFAEKNPDKYFLFMNTKKFHSQEISNIIYLDKTIDENKIVEFINTCNVMIWGRMDGETFGQAIAEFSILNKPVIATKCYEIKKMYPYMNFGPFHSHIELLGDKGLWYNNEESLYKLLDTFDIKQIKDKNWNAYQDFTPKKIMNTFKNIILDKYKIQKKIQDNFIFIQGNDQINNDLYYFNKKSLNELLDIALKDINCAGFNSIGYFKYEIDEIKKSNYLDKKQGIYIKKNIYKNYLDRKNKKKIDYNSISFITLTNNNYLDYTKNCLESLKNYNNKCPLKCYCIDTECFNHLKKSYHYTYKIKDNQDEINKSIKNSYGNKKWGDIVLKKFDIIYENLLKYEYVLFTDGDITFEKDNFIKYCYNHIDSFDLIAQNKSGTNNFNEICTGFLFIRSNELTKYYFNSKNVEFNKYKRDDQIYINNIKDKLRYKYLPKKLFPNDTYFYNNQPKNPYLIHFNSVLDGEKKKYKMIQYNKWFLSIPKKRIKVIYNWNTGKELIKDWSIMNNHQSIYKHIELVDNDEDIDYYIIVNKPSNENTKYIPHKTIIYQMEPWIYDENKNWGIKTWGKWAIPDSNLFYHIHSHDKYLNNVQWQINIPNTFPEKRKDKIVSVLSQKNFDKGHQYRIQFIKHLENKNKNYIDVYGKKNYHSFKNYQGPLKDDQKENAFQEYKYVFSCENNSEYNYATEKIWESILCECLTFYWGCPNLDDYIDKRAYITLDLSNKEESEKIIEQAIKEDWWSQKIDIIRREKEKIIHNLGFFPNLERILKLSSIDKIHTIIEDENIIVNSTPTDGSSSFVSFPIGHQWKYHQLNQEEKKLFYNHPQKNSELLLMAINDQKDCRRRVNKEITRKVIKNNLEKNGFQNQWMSSKEYFSTIGKYKFIISPEGNGIDCHRHYEAWLSGGIPIIEYNEKIAEKYNGLPILFTKDYSEINIDYLNKVYQDFKNKTFDYSKLFLNYWPQEIKKQIVFNSNHWSNLNLNSVITYIINLDRRQDRLTYMKNNMKIPFNTFSAIDGKKINQYVNDELFIDFFKHLNNKDCNLGEVGCKLSHFKLLSQINETSLILEDDIKFTDHTFSLLKEAIKESKKIKDWDLIYVGGQWTPNYGLNSNAHMKEHKIEEIHIGKMFVKKTEHLYLRTNNNDCTGFSPIYRATGAYLISKSGAEKIVQLIKKDIPFYINQPVDIWLLCLERYKKGVNFYDFFNHPFYQAGFDLDKEKCLKTSDIDRNIKNIFKLKDNNNLKDLLNNFIFYKNKDIINYDIGYDKNNDLKILLNNALNNEKCIGVNSIGFYKKIITELKESKYLNNNQGIYIKKDHLLYKSQYLQDLILNLEIFKNKKNGIFVDIGAYDGIKYSNSYFFEKKLNWKGLCIEANPDIYKKLIINGRTKSLNYAVYKDNESIDFIKTKEKLDMLSGIKETMSEEHLKRIKKEQQDNNTYDIIQVQSKSFNTIMIENDIQEIDYLSIDTEGSEYDIVLSIDFEKIKIQVIDIEVNYKNNKYEQMTEKLKKNNYKLFKQIGCDEIYLKN
jgi:FkbM family methyltransferase